VTVINTATGREDAIIIEPWWIRDVRVIHWPTGE
jgi:hypothetical protein